MREFNTVFQQKTHNVWSVFGLRGPGGIFLNKLVKYAPQEEVLTEHVRTVVRVIPQTSQGIWEAHQRMHHLVNWLERLIVTGQVTRENVQPGRVPFFLSACWHLQAPERWPIFYGKVRRVLLQEDGREGAWTDPIETYFAFRGCFLSLAQALDLSVWTMEHLCRWYGEQITRESAQKEKDLSGGGDRDRSDWRPRADLTRVVPADREGKTQHIQSVSEDTHRTHLEWLLARIGKKVGCRVWIAGDDHHRMWQQERLGDVSLETLSLMTDPHRHRVLGHIDVLWFQKNELVAA